MKALIFACFAVGLAAASFGRDITTLDGTTYKNVQISNVTPAGFDIAYTPKGGGLGIKEIFFKNLPEAMRKEFGYSPKRAGAFEKKVNKIRLQRAKKQKWLYEQKQKKEMEEQAINDHLMAQIQAGRQRITLKVVRPTQGGVIGWGELMQNSVTTGQLGKIFVVGLDLPNGGEWAGYIYPIKKPMEGYPAYATSIEKALVLIKANIKQGYYKNNNKSQNNSGSQNMGLNAPQGAPENPNLRIKVRK